jgi:hypothetical protein
MAPKIAQTIAIPAAAPPNSVAALCGIRVAVADPEAGQTSAEDGSPLDVYDQMELQGLFDEQIEKLFKLIDRQLNALALMSPAINANHLICPAGSANLHICNEDYRSGMVTKRTCQPMFIPCRFTSPRNPNSQFVKVLYWIASAKSEQDRVCLDGDAVELRTA